MRLKVIHTPFNRLGRIWVCQGKSGLGLGLGLGLGPGLGLGEASAAHYPAPSQLCRDAVPTLPTASVGG